MTVFDLIIVRDLIEQMKNMPVSQRGHTGSGPWRDLFNQVHQRCDCHWPDGTSTKRRNAFGLKCWFCSRSDYDKM
jgi:hypothetical protein